MAGVNVANGRGYCRLWSLFLSLVVAIFVVKGTFVVCSIIGIINHCARNIII
jgi:hypothetical protein